MNKLFMSNLNRIITLLVLVFALFVLFKSEQASAQTIDASPNPVPVYAGQQGSTTITWSAPGGGGVPAGGSIYYTTNGANETFFTSGITGTQVADFIEAGNTYVFTLYNLNKTMVLDSVTVETFKRYKKSNIKLKPKFRNMEIKPHGTYVDFKFNSSFSALAFVRVSYKKPLDVPSLSKEVNEAFNKNDVLDLKLAQKGKTHSARIKNLNAYTTYYYEISAYDSNTKYWLRKTGSFKTKERIVDVEFNKLEVYENGDGGDAVLIYQFFINEKNIEDNVRDDLTAEQAFSFVIPFADDDYKSNFSHKKTVINNAINLNLKVRGLDHDGGLVGCGSDGYFQSPFNKNSGDNGCYEYTSRGRDLDVTPNTDLLGADFGDSIEEFNAPFEIYAYPYSSDSDLRFRVFGKIKVSYKK